MRETLNRQLILILGGARSGKSSYAEGLAARLSGPSADVLYVATAQALDAEMVDRIAHHRSIRPATWRTVEEPINLATAIAQQRGTASVILIDCLTLWLSNLMFSLQLDENTLPDSDNLDAAARQSLESLLTVYQAATATMILVSNEVGMGIVPSTPMGRLYRDALGRVNAWLAANASQVVLMIAGLPLPIKTLQS